MLEACHYGGRGRKEQSKNATPRQRCHKAAPEEGGAATDDKAAPASLLACFVQLRKLPPDVKTRRSGFAFSCDLWSFMVFRAESPKLKVAALGKQKKPRARNAAFYFL